MQTERESARAGVSARLAQQAALAPERIAVVDPDGTSTSFGALEARVNRIARGLVHLGVGPKDRCSLFVPAGAELIASVHALFRLGAIPVLIDPGMGRRNLLACVERTAPRVLIGVPRVHVARLLFPGAFRSVELCVTAGRRAGWGGSTLSELERRGASEEVAETLSPDPGPNDLAAILFTSGSTGTPKGVEYTHANFAAQLDALAELYGLEAGQVDVACFPLFALFDNALGMTSVFPRLDPTRMAKANPAEIARAIEEQGATFTFGSPAVWKRFVPWAQARGFRFSKLQRITIAGAPVPPALVLDLRDLLPAGGEVHTPYGATESLPVANISSTQLEGDIALRTENGEGTCVGRPAPGMEIRLIPLSDEAVDSMEALPGVPAGQPGEVCVRGPVVTRAYADAPGATRLSKIPSEAAGSNRALSPWHRMGDVGVFDSDGLLWFHGRKSHRLQTPDGLLMPVPIENLFGGLPELERVALVGVGARGEERPVLVVEAKAGVSHKRAVAAARSRARTLPQAAPIEAFLAHRSFPVDVRHNSKIHRLELKRWAESKLR